MEERREWRRSERRAGRSGCGWRRMAEVERRERVAAEEVRRAGMTS